MILPEEFSYVTQALKTQGIYEPIITELMRKHAKGICIDVGAHIGYYTLLMAKTASKVYAFEPDMENFKILKTNIELNKLTNVTVMGYAAYDKTQALKLYHSEICTGMHRCYKSVFTTNDSQQVQAVKLDDLLPTSNFVKIDVEGLELKVLQGMERLVTADHPKIVMEFIPDSIKEAGINPNDVLDFLFRKGYKVRHIGDNIFCE